jgi:hypothetical protein
LESIFTSGPLKEPLAKIVSLQVVHKSVTKNHGFSDALKSKRFLKPLEKIGLIRTAWTSLFFVVVGKTQEVAKKKEEPFSVFLEDGYNIAIFA